MAAESTPSIPPSKPPGAAKSSQPAGASRSAPRKSSPVNALATGRWIASSPGAPAGGGLLVLLERHTRYVLLRPLRAISQSAVHRAPVYHTHAYTSWEKGSVEHANGLLRFWFPKGTDFSKVSPVEIAFAQNQLNTISRTHSLKGLTAHEAFLALS